MTVAKIQFHTSALMWLVLVLRSRTYSWANTPRHVGRYARRDGVWTRCSHGFGVIARRAVGVTEPTLAIVLLAVVIYLILRGI